MCLHLSRVFVDLDDSSTLVFHARMGTKGCDSDKFVNRTEGVSCLCQCTQAVQQVVGGRSGRRAGRLVGIAAPVPSFPDKGAGRFGPSTFLLLSRFVIAGGSSKATTLNHSLH